MNIELNKFLKSVLKFISFVIIFYSSLVCIWGDFAPKLAKKNIEYLIGSYGHTFTRLKEVKQIKNIDILFLGSSHTYREFDTRIFKRVGFKTFNLGSSSQTPMETLVLLKRYLSELNPKTIIYEVSPITFSIDGVESALDIISNDENDIESIIMALELNNIKVYNTLIYGFYRNVFDKNEYYKENIEKGEDRYIPGGFVEKNIKYFNYAKHEKSEWNLIDDQFYYFENILKIIKEHRINLILVQAPITRNLYESYSNNYIFDKRMSKYDRYINFNKIMELDDSLHFYDSHHLNQDGVVLFNNKLIDMLFEK